MAIFEISQKTYGKLEGIYSPTLYRKLILRFVGCATLEGWLGKRCLAFPRLKLDGFKATNILETIHSSVFPGDTEVSWLSMRYDVTCQSPGAAAVWHQIKE